MLNEGFTFTCPLCKAELRIMPRVRTVSVQSDGKIFVDFEEHHGEHTCTRGQRGVDFPLGA